MVYANLCWPVSFGYDDPQSLVTTSIPLHGLYASYLEQLSPSHEVSTFDISGQTHWLSLGTLSVTGLRNHAYEQVYQNHSATLVPLQQLIDCLLFPRSPSLINASPISVNGERYQLTWKCVHRAISDCDFVWCPIWFSSGVHD